MRLPKTPFVLIDDARPGGRAHLYHGYQDSIRADRPDQVAGALASMQCLYDGGTAMAGYIAYEAASGIEPHAETHRDTAPCLWFGAFARCDSVDAAAILPDPAGAWAGRPRPRITQSTYAGRFARVRELIEAGDIYQANLTFRADVPVAGHPAALYALLRTRAAAGYGALMFTGERWLLSFSPELMLEYGDDGFVSRPMKGTAMRGRTPVEDDANATALSGDPKQRAENLMIVDLIRNDLTRVAMPGTVRVPELFTVERYPTVLQMVSTVTAVPGDGKGPVDALAAMFPCGSITGAPKIRAMQVITEVEDDARGVYTGAVGCLDRNGGARFNVAIRTLTLEPGAASALLGLGSGVVADSNAAGEWEECIAKGTFVTAGETGFDLIETMGFDPDHGITLLERHLARMKASAETFGFAFDRHHARNELQAATFRLMKPSRVRLLLAPSGAIAIGIAPLPERAAAPMRAAVAPLPVAPDDFRLSHKTSRRSFYDRARAESGADEIVFTDPHGFVTEGSFTNVFVERGGKLVTPPLARGLLPGVLRAELIESGRAVEGDLTPDELTGGFLLGNALRGLVSAVTVAEARSATV